MTLLLERLQELVPAVKDNRKASQKKILNEAMTYLAEQKPGERETRVPRVSEGETGTFA